MLRIHAGLVALALFVSASACVNDQSEFEVKAGNLVCEWNARCAHPYSGDTGDTGDAGEVVLDGPHDQPRFPDYPTDSTCVEVFHDKRVVCDDCDYDPDEAYTCLRRLKKAVDGCTREYDLTPCEEVYSSCAGYDEYLCDLEEPESPWCSLTDRPGRGAGFGLLALLAFVYRRRCR